MRAVLLDDVPRNVAGDGTTSDRIAARVRWTDHDGFAHTDKALVDSGLKAGARTVVWTDGRDEITAEPPTPMDASVEAGALATVAALAFTGIAFGAGTLARCRLDRRRIDQWARTGTRSARGGATRPGGTRRVAGPNRTSTRVVPPS
ncbi:Rv1733c family protein [Streptomyces antimycoticus]